MQQRASGEVPGDHVGPARELVMLIRLIDTDGVTQRTQPVSLLLAHGGMNQVDLPSGQRLPPAGIDKGDLEAKTKRFLQPDVGRD